MGTPQPKIEPKTETIQVHGRDYLRRPYDWYIDEALFLAPETWSYEQVVSLRDAIRENYQHGLSINTCSLEKDDEALREFIKTVIATDPVATIRHEDLWT